MTGNEKTMMLPPDSESDSDRRGDDHDDSESNHPLPPDAVTQASRESHSTCRAHSGRSHETPIHSVVRTRPDTRKPRTRPNSMPSSPPYGEESKTLWMGELEPWMTEKFIISTFQRETFNNIQVRIIMDRSGAPAGYCFVYFSDFRAALRALEQLNGHSIPNTQTHFHLNWATKREQDYDHGFRHSEAPFDQFAEEDEEDDDDDDGDREDAMHAASALKRPGKQPKPVLSHHDQDNSDEVLDERLSLFVGNLSPAVDRNVLVNFFRQRYPSVKFGRVVCDESKRPKGFGFVTFTSERELQHALHEMNGEMLIDRPIRVNAAQRRHTSRSTPA